MASHRLELAQNWQPIDSPTRPSQHRSEPSILLQATATPATLAARHVGASSSMLAMFQFSQPSQRSVVAIEDEHHLYGSYAISRDPLEAGL